MTLNCKALWMRADVKLKCLIPIIQQLCLSELELPKDQRNHIFNQFFNTLIKGAELLKRCENISAFNIFLRFRYASEIFRLEEEIRHFMDLIPAHILLDSRKLKQELQDYYQELQPADMSNMLKESICKPASLLTNNASRNTILLQQMRLDDSCEDEGFNHSVHDMLPVKSQFYVGIEKSIGDLKRLLFQQEVSVVGVQCIGGGGKTTLAMALCSDEDIKGCFQNVVFITVSQSPNVKGLLETMWDKIVGLKRPEFQNVEDARMQLQKQLQGLSKSTLVVLDDVWSRVNLEKLLFQGARYKTLVTTRDSSSIPRNHSTQLYQLPLLGHEDALSLFCFWAFGQTSIPTNEDASLVKEVQAECKGLPLALKVIGSCLNGETRVAWESARTKLSKREPISDYHRDGLFRCLETSISILDDVARECFLDLGAFPEDKKICADVLLHIWVYVRKLEWHDAFAILLELARRNLLNITCNSRNTAEISYGNASELYFSQHDVLRDLALYLGGQGIAFQKKRLIMPRKENILPVKWELLKDRPFDAQILSIYTGPMDKSDWYEINFPKTEALVILFAASEYRLPPFIKSMKNLKVLMVCNYSSKRATIEGLDVLSSLPQLRSVRLERLVAPNLQKQSNALHNLEKLSLSLCEGFGSASTFDYTKLQEFNVDHCSDLEEMPPAICHMPSARIWSVTNCHLVQNLPHDLGNLSCLIMLRLSALPGLKELPPSIGKLGQLEYLDISVCEGLKELPNEIGQLKKLKEIDMRECSRLKRLPRSVLELSSLKRVICDEKIEKQWLLANKISIPELKVEVVEAQFSLEWLDD
ncbi:putative disease resistance protein At5g47280 [Cryptomeria japonica]|uniref:putative disease resistance protein At5g47280 n=1 Tax=Cryptomeria japonica TaxID=3369 RepID=UPI0025AB99DB|nr:putative disease resistance protein At5g47280 [Cryptomeria japonica]